jgi:SPP1 gp7 family putative phage head morphogenesis protein
MPRPDPEVVARRLHKLLARRVAAHEGETDEIVAEMYRAVRDLPPGSVAAALRLAAAAYAASLTDSAHEGIREAARLGAQASHGMLRAALGRGVPPATGWEAAARAVEARGPDGLSLSSRVHRQTAVYRAQLDRVLAQGIREGTGATETARRLVNDYAIRGEPIVPRSIRALADAVKQMGVGGGDAAYAAATRAAVDVRRGIERLATMPRARHGMAPATEHMLDTVMQAVWDGKQEVADKAIRWWAHDKVRYQMETVVRTESQRAYALAFEEHARQVPAVEGLIWHSAHDEGVCEVCLELDAQTFAMDDHPEMPAHPRCRCRWGLAINRAALPGEIVRRALEEAA